MKRRKKWQRKTQIFQRTARLTRKTSRKFHMSCDRDSGCVAGISFNLRNYVLRFSEGVAMSRARLFSFPDVSRETLVRCESPSDQEPGRKIRGDHDRISRDWFPPLSGVSRCREPRASFERAVPPEASFAKFSHSARPRFFATVSGLSGRWLNANVQFAPGCRSVAGTEARNPREELSPDLASQDGSLPAWVETSRAGRMFQMQHRTVPIRVSPLRPRHRFHRTSCRERAFSRAEPRFVARVTAAASTNACARNAADKRDGDCRDP